MSKDDDPEITRRLRQQARTIGVYVGVLVLGRVGLLDGRRFVTHWYYRGHISPSDRGG